MHKVLDFERYNTKPLSESTYRVNLVQWKKDEDLKVLKRDLSLEELYDHVSPGRFIYHADEVSKKFDEKTFGGKVEETSEQNIATQYNNYAIGIAHGDETGEVVKVSNKGSQANSKQLGALKIIIMLISSPVAYRRMMLDKAYQFIELGSPVEFRFHLSGSTSAKKNRGKSPNSGAVSWLQDYFPHLRPDFVLKAMPEGTKFFIDPVTDGSILQFVLGRPAEQMPKLDLTTRLFRVKVAVEESLPNNPMAQRHQQKKMKMIREGGNLREMSEDEKAQQEQVLENADADEEVEGDGGKVGLTLNKMGVKEKNPRRTDGPNTERKKKGQGRGKQGQ